MYMTTRFKDTFSGLIWYQRSERGVHLCQVWFCAWIVKPSKLFLLFFDTCCLIPSSTAKRRRTDGERKGGREWITHFSVNDGKETHTTHTHAHTTHTRTHTHTHTHNTPTFTNTTSSQLNKTRCKSEVRFKYTLETKNRLNHHKTIKVISDLLDCLGKNTLAKQIQGITRSLRADSY